MYIIQPFDPSVKRTESTVRDKHTNEEYKVTKGMLYNC